MLPAATSERMQRESVRGKLGGRTYEIQRLIGRSLRGVVDTSVMGEKTVTIDCDVLQADGGTRCASITGGYVALVLALRKAGLERAIVEQDRGHQRGHRGRPGRCSTSSTARTPAPRSTSTSSAPTPAPTSSCRAPPRASPSTAPRWTTLLDLADGGLKKLFEHPGRGARRRGGEGQGDDPAPAAGHRARAQGGRAAGAAGPRRRRAGHARRGRHRGRAGGGRRHVRGQRRDQGALLRRAFGPAHAGRRLGPGGRCARRRARRLHQALRRPDATDEDNNDKLLEALEGLPGRSGEARATSACWPSSTRQRRRAGLPRRRLRGPHRDRAAGQRRLRLRPHLRARG